MTDCINTGFRALGLNALCLILCLSAGAQQGESPPPLTQLQDSVSSLRGTGEEKAATTLQRQVALRMLFEKNETDRAIGLLLNTIYQLESLGDSALANRCREDLARIYTSKQYYFEALYHFQYLRDFYRRKNQQNPEAIIKHAIADVYVAMDSLQRATPLYLQIEEFNQAQNVALLEEVHDASVTALTRQGYGISGLTDTSAVDFGGLVDQKAGFQALCLLNSGHRYFSSQELNMARHYYQLCLEEDNLDDVIRRDALYKLARIYQRIGNWERAYGYLEQYSFINDSLINDRRQRVIDRLLVTYQTYEQKLKIRELEKDQKIAAFQNRLQNVLTFSLLFGSIIVLIGAYFTIRNYQHRFNANQIIHRQTTEINRQRITELENNVKIESMNSMIQGQEAERERVAKDLHDSLGGLLSTIKLHFDAVQSQDGSVVDIPEYRRAYKLLDDACNEVRHISNNLQPGALHKLGLVPAVQDLIARVQPAEGPRINFNHAGVNGVLDARVSLNVYRIIQELLNNALKHAEAKEIDIILSQSDNALSVIVEDDGRGYEPGTIKSGMGAENVASRVNYLKGDISIHSVLGEGTTTQIDIPLSV